MKYIIALFLSFFIAVGAMAQVAPSVGDAGASNLFCTKKGAEIVYEAFGSGNVKLLETVGEQCFQGPFVPVIIEEVVKNQVDKDGDKMWMLKVGEDMYTFQWTKMEGEEA
ncbi:MAG: hypothetical protein ACXABY_27060 [Candidatus Thorarchaeota archaeon]|jgi:hypothetical protein